MIARTLLAISREDLRSRTMATLAEMQDVEVVGIVENSSDLLLAADTSADIDLVLVDEGIGSLPCLTLARELVARHPDIGVMLLATEPSSAFFQSAMDAGARAVFEGSPSVDELSERIAAILSWQRQVRAMGGTGLGGTENAGRLIAFSGAKGGVGTTTAALHAALLAVSLNPDRRVCLLDLDLQQRGLRQILDVNGRRTIGDLVSVADSLTGRNLDEAVLVHQSGLRVLLAPLEGESGEDVTSEIARQVVAAAKSHFDLVIADCGSVITEGNAVGLEFADDIALVTTSDVPSLRASHDKIEMLSRLQIAKSSDITLLFNKVSSRNEVQPDLGRRLTGAEGYRATIPEDWKHLEPVMNSMAPLDLEDGPFRRAIIALGRELKLGTEAPAPARPAVTPAGDPDPDPEPRRRKERTSMFARKGDAGQITIDALVGVVVAVVILLILMQTAIFAVGAVSSRRAADAAALIESRGGSPSQVYDAADSKTPPMFKVHVTKVGSNRVEARLGVPILLPFLQRDISSTASAAEEG